MIKRAYHCVHTMAQLLQFSQIPTKSNSIFVFTTFSHLILMDYS